MKIPQTQALELLHPQHRPDGKIRAAIFDFDGTFSTLRCGWEQVMRPLMLEVLSGGSADAAPAELQSEVDEYIDASTGIQTVYQMRWLAQRAQQAGHGVPGRDEWWYKAEYNRRLMQTVSERMYRLQAGQDAPEQYLICGAVAFLRALHARGVALYLASGTDHDDVLHEAAALGVARYFTAIQGAPQHRAACSKEAVLQMILTEKRLPGSELLLVGDGKVEIALGAKAGAFTLGAATDEVARCGLNPVKRERLIAAGADAICGDFTQLDALLCWLGL